MGLCINRPDAVDRISNTRKGVGLLTYSRDLFRKTQPGTLPGGIVSPRAPFGDANKPEDKLPTIRPKNPAKFDMPSVMPKFRISAQTLNFEDGIISYTYEYEAPSQFEKTSSDCPPALTGNPPLPVTQHYPFDRPDRVTRSVSLNCEDNPEYWAWFLSNGRGGLESFTKPDNYTGQLAEEFFNSVFLNDNLDTDNIPDNFRCVRSIVLCGEQTSGKDSPIRLRAVTIDSDTVKYNLTINGKPASYFAERKTDAIPLDEKILDFPAIPPLLERDLGALHEIAQKIGGAGFPDTSEDEEKEGEARDECENEPDVAYSDIQRLFQFNYSFFSEKIIDALFMRMWMVIEYVLYMFWLIFPLCDEWSQVKFMVKRIFSVDPLVGDGNCFPAPVEKVVDKMVEVGRTNTCCKGNPLSFSCILFKLICFLRWIRNLIFRIFLWIMYFILWAITYGAEVICALITGKPMPDLNKRDQGKNSKLGEELNKIGDAIGAGSNYTGEG